MKVRQSTLTAIHQRMIQYQKTSRNFSSFLPARSIKKNFPVQSKSADQLTDNLKKYKRDAIISIAGFAAMKIIEKFSPTTFAGLKILRMALVLGIGRDFIKNGIECLFKDKRPNADTLTATAVIASVIAGKPESSLTLLALSNGAEMLTSYAAEKARTHISGLLSLDQRFVWKVVGGERGAEGMGGAYGAPQQDGSHEVEVKIPVEEVKTGDIIASHTGEKIVVDGIVIEGTAAVNQASITGESRPAMKQVGAQVYAGSVVEAGEVLIRVEKVGKDTSLANIVHLVEEAQTRKAPVQNFADQMANFLVPVSFIGAAIVYGATRDWQRVLNLLFIDFSCGLKLSTATAISAAIGAAAKRGILVKGGNYIEALANTDTVVLDKTGTLTMGVPQIAFIKTAKGVKAEELILLAASAEQHSVHPLAVAIQNYVNENNWIVPQHLKSETVVARGMTAVVPDFGKFKGGDVLVGSKKFMLENGVNPTDIAEVIQGGTITKVADGAINEDSNIETRNLLYISRNGKLIGLIGIEDPIRPQMKKTLNQMRRYGVDEIVMLTGDSKSVAEKVAREMDLDAYFAEILPEDKARYVNKLKQYGTVMMVGDGINDAPALAFSDVGITLGGRQTDIAAESSAVTIHSEEPAKLVEALRIGRRTMNLIQQNFTATILVNSSAMILGAIGKISPLWAAIIHNTATLAVVLNSCRILSPEKNKNFGKKALPLNTIN